MFICVCVYQGDCVAMSAGEREIESQYTFSSDGSIIFMKEPLQHTRVFLICFCTNVGIFSPISWLWMMSAESTVP